MTKQEFLTDLWIGIIAFSLILGMALKMKADWIKKENDRIYYRESIL